MLTSGVWQLAYVVYENPTSIAQFYKDDWSVFIQDFALRVTPLDLSKELLEQRKNFCLKVTGLPFNTSHVDLLPIMTSLGAKSCFIPKTQEYKQHRYAFVAFENEKRQKAALASHYMLGGKKLLWMSDKQKHCYTCGSGAHLAKDCTAPKKTGNRFQHLYEKYKPAQYQNKIPPKKNIPADRNRNHVTQIPEGTSYSNVVKSKPKSQPPVTGGTSKGGSVHEKPSIDTQIEKICKSIQILSNDLAKIQDTLTALDGKVGDLTIRVEALESDASYPDIEPEYEEEENPTKRQTSSGWNIQGSSYGIRPPIAFNQDESNNTYACEEDLTAFEQSNVQSLRNENFALRNDLAALTEQNANSQNQMKALMQQMVALQEAFSQQQQQ